MNQLSKKLILFAFAFVIYSADASEQTQGETYSLQLFRVSSSINTHELDHANNRNATEDWLADSKTKIIEGSVISLGINETAIFKPSTSSLNLFVKFKLKEVNTDTNVVSLQMSYTKQKKEEVIEVSVAKNTTFNAQVYSEKHHDTDIDMALGAGWLTLGGFPLEKNEVLMLRITK